MHGSSAKGNGEDAINTSCTQPFESELEEDLDEALAFDTQPVRSDAGQESDAAGFTLNELIEQFNALEDSLAWMSEETCQVDSNVLLAGLGGGLLGPNINARGAGEGKSGDYSSLGAYFGNNGMNYEAEIETSEKILSQAPRFVHELYAFRGFSKAFPNLESDASGEKKLKYYRACFEILQPGFTRLQALRSFAIALISHAKTFLEKLAVRKGILDNMICAQIVALVDTVGILDLLKDSKPCLKNDLSCYKRTLHMLKDDMEPSIFSQLTQGAQEMQEFLNSPCFAKGGALLLGLAASLRNTRAVMPYLGNLVQWCTKKLRKCEHALPEDRFQLLRAVPHLLVLMEQASPNTTEGVNELKSTLKRVLAPDMARMLRRNACIPFFADSHIKVAVVLGRCRHPDHFESLLSCGSDSMHPRASLSAAEERKEKKRAGRFSIGSGASKALQTEHATLMSRLATIMHKISAQNFICAPYVQLSRDAYACVVDGLKFLSNCRDHVISQTAYKLANPVAIDQGACFFGHPGYDYARAAVDNHSRAELASLIQVVCMAKELAAALQVHAPKLAPVLRVALRALVHDFVDHDLSDLCENLDSTSKEGRSVQATLNCLRRVLGADPIGAAAFAAVTGNASFSSPDSSPSNSFKGKVPDCTLPCDDAAIKVTAENTALNSKVGAVNSTKWSTAAGKKIGHEKIGAAFGRGFRFVATAVDKHVSQVASASSKASGNARHADHGDRHSSSRPSSFSSQASSSQSYRTFSSSFRSSGASGASSNWTFALPSPTQFQVLWCMTAALLAELEGEKLAVSGAASLFKQMKMKNFSKLGGNLGMRSDNRSAPAVLQRAREAISSFCEVLLFKDAILDLSATLRTVSNFGELWYREFYLDITKSTQFPIEMSMPWTLIKEIIEEPASHPDNALFYLLDLYNDAAAIALARLEQQFLFDEIEAELNLVMDQLIFLLPRHVYTQIKGLACFETLEPKYKSKAERAAAKKGLALLSSMFSGGASAGTCSQTILMRYKTALSKRFASLLGRTLDLGSLFAERLAQSLRDDLATAIATFQGVGLTDVGGVLDLSSQLRVLSRTHEMLDDLGGVEYLPKYSAMLAEADGRASVSCTSGIIAAHVVSEVVLDVMPNFGLDAAKECFVVSTLLVAIPRTTQDRISSENEPEPASSLRVAQPVELIYSKSAQRWFEAQHKKQRGLLQKPHMVALTELLGGAGSDRIMDVVEQISLELDFKIERAIGPLAKLLCSRVSGNTEYRALHDPSKVWRALAAQYDGLLALPASGDPFVTSDMSTKVFQSFREFGNAVAFLKLFLDVVDEADLAEEQKPKCLARFDSVVMVRLRKSISRNGFATELNQAPAGQDTVLQPFYRLWSAFQFLLLNNEEPTENGIGRYGDGFGWAGSLIMHVLSQHDKFDLWDGSYHVLHTWSLLEERKRQQMQLISQKSSTLSHAPDVSIRAISTRDEDKQGLFKFLAGFASRASKLHAVNDRALATFSREGGYFIPGGGSFAVRSKEHRTAVQKLPFFKPKGLPFGGLTRGGGKKSDDEDVALSIKFKQLEFF